MKDLQQKYQLGQLPTDDFTKTENQLLRTHLDRDRRERWEKMVGAEKSNIHVLKSARFGRRFWSLAIAACVALLAGLGYFVLKLEPKPSNQLALGQAVVPFSFEDFHPRGATGSFSTAAEKDWRRLQKAFEQGQFEEAIHLAGPKTDAFFLGMCYFSKKEPDFKKAVACFDEALQKPDADAEILYYKGIAQFQLGEKTAARATLEQAANHPHQRGEWKSASNRLLNLISK